MPAPNNKADRETLKALVRVKLEEGNVCLYPQDVFDWLMTFQSADQWWPERRPGEKASTVHEDVA